MGPRWHLCEKMKPEMPLNLEALLAEADWLRPLARRLARHSDTEADDLMQDSVEAALRKPPTNSEKLRPWLRRVMFNVHAMRKRSDARRRAREQRLPDADGPLGPASLVERAEHRHLIAQAVLQIKEPYRSTLLQHYFEGWSTTKIARHESIQASTVRVRLKRGLDLVRAELERSWGSDWRANCFAIAGAPPWLPAVTWAGAAIAASLLVVLGLNPGLFGPATGGSKGLEAGLASDPSQGDPSSSNVTNRQPLAALDEGELNSKRTESTPLIQEEGTRIRVLDAITLQPVAGAGVYVIPPDGENGWARPLLPRLLSYRDLIDPNQPPVAQTDGSGECLIQPVKDVFNAWVESEGRSAVIEGLSQPRQDWEPRIEEPVRRVLIHRGLTVRVRSVDESGSAVPHIPVALSLRGESGTSRPERWEGWPRATAVSDEGGQALLEVPGADLVDAINALESAQRAAIVDLSIRTPLGLSQTISVSLPLEVERQEVIEVTLVAPASGSIQLEVKDAPREARAFLVPASDFPKETRPLGLGGPLSRSVEGVAMPDGAFSFSSIPLHQSWVAIVASSPLPNLETNWRTVAIAGPRTDGERIVAALDYQSGSWLRGSFVDGIGALPGPRRGELTLLSNGKRTSFGPIRFAIRADGSFAASLEFLDWDDSGEGEGSQPVPIEEAIFEVQLENRDFHERKPLPGSARRSLPEHALHLGHDFGQVHLGSAPKIAAGRVLDSNRSPVAGARVSVSESYRIRSRPDEERWHHQGDTFTDLEGRFFINENLSKTRGTDHYSLQVSLPSTEWDIVHAVQVFQGRQEGIEIVLPETGSLKISYTNQLPQTLRSTLAIRSDPRYFELELPEQLNQVKDDVIRTIPNLPAGIYSASLRIKRGWDTVQAESLGEFRVLPNAEVEPPSLNGLDLGAILQATRLQLEVPSELASEKMPTSGTLYQATTGRTARSIVAQVDGQHMIFHYQLDQARRTGANDRGWLCFDGFQAVHLDNVRENQTVRIEAEPELKLHVTRIPQLPVGQFWEVQFVWLDAPLELQPSRRGPKLDPSGRAKLPLPGFGSYQLNWSLLASEDRTVIDEHQSTIEIKHAQLSSGLELSFPEPLTQSSSRD